MSQKSKGQSSKSTKTSNDKNKSKYSKPFRYFAKKYKNEVMEVGRVLGQGAFGEVRDIKYKGKMMAVKIIEKESNEESNKGEKLSVNLRTHNIVKILKYFESENFRKYEEEDSDNDDSNSIKNKYYDFIIMEKAVLRDLGKLNEFHHRHNLLKLIKNKIDDPYQFDENTGDFLIKFYGRQIINSL